MRSHTLAVPVGLVVAAATAAALACGPAPADAAFPGPPAVAPSSAVAPLSGLAPSDTVVGDSARRSGTAATRAGQRTVRPGVRRAEGTDLPEVRGQVLEQESSRAVSAATVRIRRAANTLRGPGLVQITDESGRFRFSGVPSGEYSLRITHLGFRTRTDTIRVEPDQNLYLEAPLTAEPVAMEPLVVRLRVDWLSERGFYRRMDKGLGRFLTPEELDKRNVNRLTQILKSVPGVRLVKNCSRIPCDRFLRMNQTHGNRQCSVAYYMDGRQMHGRVYPDDINVEDLAAVEIYRGISETPAEYFGPCGSVVIWSKRRM